MVIIITYFSGEKTSKTFFWRGFVMIATTLYDDFAMSVSSSSRLPQGGIAFIHCSSDSLFEKEGTVKSGY
jgi:hypothetical protein